MNIEKATYGLIVKTNYNSSKRSDFVGFNGELYKILAIDGNKSGILGLNKNGGKLAKLTCETIKGKTIYKITEILDK